MTDRIKNLELLKGEIFPYAKAEQKTYEYIRHLFLKLKLMCSVTLESLNTQIKKHSAEKESPPFAVISSKKKRRQRKRKGWNLL